MATRKTTTLTVTGTVERAELKHRPPYDPYIGRYDPLPTERRDYYLDVTLRLDDGSTVYFNTTSGRMTISVCPGAAVVTISIDGGAADFLEEVKGNAVATAEKPNANSIRPLVKVGDTITVTGRVKTATVSKKGNPYKVLTHVRRENKDEVADRVLKAAAHDPICAVADVLDTNRVS